MNPPQNSEAQPNRKPFRRKIVWIGLVFAFAAAAILASTCSPSGPTQIITLSNGEQYEFAGVTFGRSPIPPTLAARIFHWLPARVATMVANSFGSASRAFYETPNSALPELHVWLRVVGTNTASARGAMSLRARLADKNGTEIEGQNVVSADGPWACASFQTEPRRSPVIRCRFYGAVAQTPSKSDAEVRFTNPLYREYPQWKAEPTPATKQAGDLEMILNSMKFVGVGSSVIVTFDLSFASKSRPNAEWAIATAELSDATGNAMHYERRGLSPDTQFSLARSLWPGEKAWKLKLGIKCISGFDPSELTTLTNVPVPTAGGTNTFSITNTIGGMNNIMRMGFGRPPGTPPGQPSPGQGSQVIFSQPNSTLQLETLRLPEGVFFELVKITMGAGEEIEFGSIGPYYAFPLLNPSGGQPILSGAVRNYSLASMAGERAPKIYSISYLPLNTTNLNLTWTAQKLRTVEFLVAPPDYWQ